MKTRLTMFQRMRQVFIGDARNISDPSIFHKMSLIAFFAWVGLGADGITSSCYGPEEAFIALGKHHTLAIFVALATVITIFIISASYHQIIELFPTGGGGYLVASKLLSPTVGMVSGSALLIDYLLTITLSIASGADALFSFLPAAWYPYRITVAVIGVALLMWLNMRGVKESVMPLIPIFIIFVITHIFAVIYSIYLHAGNIPAIASETANQVQSTTSEMGIFGMLFLIMRAYSMGAGTFTGIEAVSNGIPILREPKVKTATRTMHYMAVSLAVMVGGLMVAYILFNVKHVPGKTLNAVLFTAITSGWPGSWGYAFVLVTLISEALLLFVAAQTGFLDGPRVLSNMALDRWAPARFSSLNDRLVTQNGILIMGIAAIVLMIYSGGSVRFLVVLYSINVFVTFSLSQLGMVRHWWMVRKTEKGWFHRLLINTIGLMLTLTILASVSIIKFHEGGWLTIFITGSIVGFAVIVKRHYKRTGKMLGRLSGLVELAQIELTAAEEGKKKRKRVPACDPSARTAVLFVNGFSGTGLHTLLSIIRLFEGIYKNFVFVQIGLVDSGVFKGHDELEHLRQEIARNADRYVDYMRLHGRYAESVTALSVDVVQGSVDIAPKILEKFPSSTFFAGQIVFPVDSFFSRWLHNYSAFAIQRRYYNLGIPIVILPIRV